MKSYRPSAHHIPELNGLRVLLVFIVSWYHIWQQSWLTPQIGSYSLDFLVRSGYVPVDGTILLSGFLLFLPHARAMLLGEPIPSTRSFYQRRVMRIVPSYYFVTLLMLFVVAIPYDSYHGYTENMVRDVVMHLTFTQTFNYATYIATPIGVASWTIAIEMQAYLVFPLLAKAARRNPLGTLASMVAATLLFRTYCLWALDDYNMVVNQLINFLDVYALGMAASLLYVKLTTLYPQDKGKYCWQAVATVLVFASLYGLMQALRAQAGSPNTAAIQSGQMFRRPIFGGLLALLAVSLPFTVRPIRFLMGNRFMGFLALISMNYYLMHQNIAVHLKRLGIPPSVSDTPNMAGEQPWMTQYTWLCFGLSLLIAILITFLIEKPCAWLLGKGFKKLNTYIDERKKA
ncbi:MAG: acyltransferase [Clostridia bacterium]|nr:acyltransferase [Clostridia bacterium]